MDIALADCVDARYRFSTGSIPRNQRQPDLRRHDRYWRTCMVITAAQLSPMLSIVFGILILIVPRFLNYLVAIYLIVAGLLGLGILK
jgi:hypothetical protein